MAWQIWASSCGDEEMIDGGQDSAMGWFALILNMKEDRSRSLETIFHGRCLAEMTASYAARVVN